jgi:ubiquinone/menaquinone biosynthesis C-methylase UbiE
MQGGFGRVYN